MISNEFQKEYKDVGVCVGCGKPSTDDDSMVRLTFWHDDKTEHICLCRLCRESLYKRL